MDTVTESLRVRPAAPPCPDGDDQPMLAALGVSRAAEDVYRALLNHGPGPDDRLADVVNASVDDVRAALDDLAGLNLVSAAGDGGDTVWQAESPEVALASLVVRQQEALLERQRDLERAQSAVSELVRLSRARGRGSGGVVEATSDPQETRRRCGHFLRTARQCVMRLDTLPYGGSGGYDSHDTETDLALLARGVEVLSVHERATLLEPARFDALRRLVCAGEQARTLPTLPMRLAIYDRTNAAVSLDERGEAGTTLFVHESALLSGLLMLFEMLWERAVPLSPVLDDTGERATEFDDVLVALLAAGFKDESIARHLGISASTVTRRMARLMEQTGTSTRFQLGAQAVRRGWI